MCVCVCVVVVLVSQQWIHFPTWLKDSPTCFCFIRTALPSLSCGPRRRHQSSTRVLPPVFQYIQNSGYHPLFIAITSMEKKKSSWGFALSSGSVLVVGESFQSGNWVTSTVQREPLICWDCISAKKRFTYAALCLFLSHESHHSNPPQAHCRATVATPGILWFSAKSIQCCIVQVLHSTLKKHAYRETE